MSIKEKMTAIADNIRSKTGKSEPLNLDGMASGVNEVYEKGKKTQYDAFWDKFQQNGQRTQYNYAFGGIGWTMDTFKPKYDIEAVNVGSMFYQTGITDLETALNNAGVKFDTSEVTNFPSTFYYSDITVIPELDCRGCANTASPFALTFRYSNDLVIIRKLILPSNGTQEFNNTFTDCSSLKQITIEGAIGRSISFASCSQLETLSLFSIIQHLKDYSEDADNKGKYTITLHDSSKALLARQGATSAFGMKTYDAYIADIGWNLA